ncbi:MAG: hypothetical protein B6I34_01440 [Anaerolineaceae bacterium 4572_32.1]|nr:MAG: hypothetical protein B6I34_01440 [Anaerolineaceae bacterium 4572_32.1]
MRRRILVLLLAFLPLLLRLYPERDEYVALIQEGDAHASLKEYSFAARAYRQAATIRPGSPAPLLRLGNTFLAQAWYDRAQAALLMAHSSGGWTPELRLQMGQLYQGMGLKAEAIAQWEAALAQEPDLAQARLQLGWAYLSSELWDGASEAFEEILTRRDSVHRECWQSARYALGLLLAPKEPEQALHHLQIAAGGDDRAMADKAIILGADLQQIPPDADPAHAAALLGQAYLRVEAWSLARRMLAQAVTAEPAYAEVRAYLGHAMDHLGQPAEAERQLLLAVRLAPAETLPRYLLGLHYRRHGKPGEAALQFRQALEQDQRNAALYAELGKAWLAQHNYVDAEIAFRSAAELEPEHQGFQLLLARFYVEQLIKVRSLGLPAARKAVQLDPTDARAFDVLGWTYYLLGSPEQAENALSRAVALDPELPAARYHLGVVLLRRGRLAEANYQLWRAVDLDRQGYYRSQAWRTLGLPSE